MNLVTVDEISSSVEEEIVVSISGVQLVCFAGNMPKGIEVGKSYSVRLKLMLFHEYDLQECSSGSTESLERLGNSYAYAVKGVLLGGSICSRGFIFEDDALSDEYAYLEGRMVSLTADRIDIVF